MGFLEYQLLGVSPFGHHKAVPKIDHPGIINGEALGLPACNILFNLADASIMLPETSYR